MELVLNMQSLLLAAAVKTEYNVFLLSTPSTYRTMSALSTKANPYRVNIGKGSTIHISLYSSYSTLDSLVQSHRSHWKYLAQSKPTPLLNQNPQNRKHSAGTSEALCIWQYLTAGSGSSYRGIYLEPRRFTGTGSNYCTGCEAKLNSAMTDGIGRYERGVQ